jgi:SRSO17 transposase
VVYFFYQQLLAFSPLREIEVLIVLMHTSGVPQASPDALPALATSREPFAPLFRRAASRESVERYLPGLLTDLERNNCDTIAAAVAGTSTERWQHRLTAAAWEPQTLDQQRVTAVVSQSPPYGLLVVDDTGRPKQGRASVGVARQYSGTLGKGATWQVVVSAHDVADEPTSSAPVHWPLTARLSLPEGWATAAAHCRKVHVPAAVAFQTQPDLALTLVDQARTWGVPFAPVVADAGDGDNPAFL